MLNTTIEVAGVACLVAFASSFGQRWALLVAGVWLVLTALARDLNRKGGSDE